jgi:hypothetical protein
MAASKQLKYISDDIASPVFVANASREPGDAWNKFFDSVKGQQLVAQALMDEGGSLGTCSISLISPSDATASKDEWRGGWRDMKLTYDGSNNERIRTEDAGDPKLGDAPVAHKLELLLIKNANEANSPTFSITTPEWGPLWLIQRYKGERDKAQPTAWLVEFPVGAPGANGVIRLKLKFDRPLPEMDKWPTQ